jgi:hypothetical protein
MPDKQLRYSDQPLALREGPPPTSILKVARRDGVFTANAAAERAPSCRAYVGLALRLGKTGRCGAAPANGVDHGRGAEEGPRHCSAVCRRVGRARGAAAEFRRWDRIELNLTGNRTSLTDPPIGHV